MHNHQYQKENRYKNATIILAIICIIQCFVLGGLWFVIFRHQEQQTEEKIASLTPDPNELPVQVSQFDDPEAINQQLKTQIDQYIAQQGYNPSDLCILVESDDKTVSYRLNEEMVIEAASIYKLPLAMLYCDQIAEGTRKLEDTLVFNAEDYKTEGQNPIANQYYFGAAIPISELIQSSLIHSDNTAAAILYHGLGGWEAFAGLLKNYSNHTPQSEDPMANLATATQYMDILNRLKGDPTRYHIITQALDTQDKTLYLNELIEPVMFQKYGQLDTFTNVIGYSVSGQPYSIIVFSRTLSNPNDAGKINKIVWEVLNQVSQQQNSTPDGNAANNTTSATNGL